MMPVLLRANASRRRILATTMAIAASAIARPALARAAPRPVSPPQEFFRDLRILDVSASYILVTDEGWLRLEPRRIQGAIQAEPGGLIRNDLTVLSEARLPAVAGRISAEKVAARNRPGLPVAPPRINAVGISRTEFEDKLGISITIWIRDATAELSFVPPDGVAVLGLMERVAAGRYNVSREYWNSPPQLSVISVPRIDVNEYLLQRGDNLLAEAFTNWF